MKHSLIAGAVFAATAALAQAALAQNPVSSAIGPPIPRAGPPVNRGFGSTLPNQAAGTAGTAAMTPVRLLRPIALSPGFRLDRRALYLHPRRLAVERRG